MKKQLTTLSVLFFVAFGCKLSLAQDLQFPRTERFIESEVTRRQVPGASFAITIGNTVVTSRGLGVKNVETNEPVDADTLFHIGSTNKSITALLVSRLAEQGYLTWKSRVGEILTGVNFYDFAVPRITLQQLLSMTSGIGEVGEDDFYDHYGDFATPEQIVEFMKGYELAVLPNKEFSYSNLSASFAGYLTVYATGGDTTRLNESYAALLRANILEPLDMSRSTIFISEAKAAGNISSSHVKRNGVSSVAESEDRDNDMFAPAGSLKSSANDMAKYLMLMAQQGVAASGDRLLTERSIQKLWKPSKVSILSGDDYGLGWDKKTVAGMFVAQHEGAFDNFTSVIFVCPKYRAGLVILANTEYVGRLLSKAPKIFARELRRLGKSGMIAELQPVEMRDTF